MREAIETLDACGYDIYLILEHIEFYFDSGHYKLCSQLHLWLSGYLKGALDFSNDLADIEMDERYTLIQKVNEIEDALLEIEERSQE